MPRFSVLPNEEIEEFSRRATASVVDLTDQKNWINQAVENARSWGQIEMDPTDNVRAIKRRMTIAGKELQKVVKWNRQSDAQRLIFNIISTDEQNTRKRGRRSKKN